MKKIFCLIFLGCLFLCAPLSQASDSAIREAVALLADSNPDKVAKASAFLIKEGEAAIYVILDEVFYSSNRDYQINNNARYVLYQIGYDVVIDHLMDQIRQGNLEERRRAEQTLRDLFAHPLVQATAPSADVREAGIQEWLAWWDKVQALDNHPAFRR